MSASTSTSSRSINVAEGAGKVSAGQNLRRCSNRTGKEILWRIVAMLVKLARSLEKH
jgi:hypothetical protein